MYDVNLVEVLTLAAALYAAVMGHRLQRRFDVLAPRTPRWRGVRPIPPRTMTLRRSTSLRCVLRRKLLAGKVASLETAHNAHA